MYVVLYTKRKRERERERERERGGVAGTSPLLNILTTNRCISVVNSLDASISQSTGFSVMIRICYDYSRQPVSDPQVPPTNAI